MHNLKKQKHNKKNKTKNPPKNLPKQQKNWSFTVFTMQKLFSYI